MPGVGRHGEQATPGGSRGGDWLACAGGASGRLVLAWLGQLVALLVVAGALVWPAPVDGDALPGAFPASDLPLSHWSNAELLQRSLREQGALPRWNPSYGGGRPVAGDPLAALWYPPTYLLAVLGIRTYFAVTLIGHLVLAGFGMVLLARHAFGLSHLPALVAGVAFEASPRLVAHLGAGHVTMVQAVAWLPWLLLMGWMTVERPRWGGPALAITCALLLLAGHPQIAYYGALMLACVGGWLVVRRWRARGWHLALSAGLQLAVAALLGVLTASIHLLPLLEFTRHSTRAESFPSTDSIGVCPAVQALAGFWLESPVPHEIIIDPGRMVLVLAVLGLLSRPHRLWPVATGVCAVFFLALGVGSPLYDLVAALLPEYGEFRGVARVWFVALVGFAVLAGFGHDAVMRRVARVDARLAPVAGVLLVAAMAASLVATTSHLTRVADITPLVAMSDTEQAIVAVAGEGRIYGVQRNVRQPVAVGNDLELVDGQDPLLIAAHVRFMELAGGYTFDGYPLSVPPFEVTDPASPDFQYPDPDPELLALLGVTAVASWFEVDRPGLLKVDWSDNTHIYALSAPGGVARVTLVTTNSPMETLHVTDLRRQGRPVTEVERSAERAVYTFDAADDGYAVLGWPVFPGWQAELDGQPAELVVIDDMLPAVAVSRGPHHLVWRYESASLRWGAWLSLAGTMLTGGWIALDWLRRPRDSARSTSLRDPRTRRTAR
jgi:hypothetical protein